MLEKIFALIVMFISAQTYYLASKFDLNFIGTSGLGPEFFPKVISVVLFILALLLFITSNKENIKLNMEKAKYTFLVILVFGIYIYIIDKIGYLVSTILFAFVVMCILKNTSYKVRIIYSIVFSVGLYALFTYLFKVSLPEGLFI